MDILKVRRFTKSTAALCFCLFVLGAQSVLFAQGMDFSNILRLQAASGPYSDETVMRFVPSATYDFDGDWDAYKLPNGGNTPNIYTVMKGTKFSINSFPGDFTELVVVVKLAPAFTGNYTITSSGLDNTFDSSYSVTLEDRVMQVKQNLWTTPEYLCNLTKGDTTSRFFIHFKKATVPVTPPATLAFSGQQDGNNVVLKWTITSEMKNSYYLIYKSYNGVDYTLIDSLLSVVEGDVPTYYEWTESYRGNKTVFYEVRRFLGTDFVEVIGAAEINYINSNLSVYPNPTHGKIVIEGVSSLSKEKTYLIMDASGTVIFEKHISPNETIPSIDLDLSNHKGILSIQEISDDGIVVKRLIVM